MKIALNEALAIQREDSLPVPGNRNVTAEWTGKYPCLCQGEWIITVGGENVNLPEEIKTSHMNTFGTYDTWSFGEDWSEEWESYEDGLTFGPWAEANTWWLKDLNLSDSELRNLYAAINEEDWRHNSCGGCI